MQMSVPDPKPDARHVATREEWQAFGDLKDGPCRIGSGSHWVDHAHLVSRAQGGDDVADNIIPLGHEAHMLYHDHGKVWEHVAHMIRASLTPAEKAYILRKKGQDWLDEHYPYGDIGPLCAKCRKPLKAEKSGELEKPRPRKRYGFLVPADKAEDGADVLDGMVERCAEILAAPLGYGPTTPKFHVISSALGWFILNYEEIGRASCRERG